jgi:hypothetical protein
VLGGTLPCEDLSPLPQRPSLRSGLYCPSPSSLNRPHAPHSWAHRHFAAVRFIGDAFAVRVHLGDPGVVPCFHWHPLSTCRPLRPREVHRLLTPSSFTDNAGLRLRRTSRHFRSSPPSDSRGAMVFEVYLRFAFATTCRFACPPVGADRGFPQPTRTFTSGLSADWSPAPPPDMTTVATG